MSLANPIQHSTSTPGAAKSPQSFRSLLLKHCRQQPDFNFLTIYSELDESANTDARFSNDQLLERVADYCDYYRATGVEPGDTVLILLKESLDLYAAFFAGIIFGALPAYSAYPSPKQTAQQFLEGVENLVQYNEIRLIVGFPQVISLIKESASVSTDRFLGEVTPEQITTELKDLDLKSESSPYSRISEIPNLTEEAFLQFSSGTTGAKKGVRISVSALFNQVNAYRPFLGYDEKSKVVSWLPHYHDMGLIAGMLMPWILQVPVVMMSPFEWVKNPSMLLRAVQKFSGTHVWQPNFAFGHLRRHVGEQADQFDLSSVKKWIGCSEPVLPETINKFCETFAKAGVVPHRIGNCYAMAENTFAVSSTPLDQPLSTLLLDESHLRNGSVVPSSSGSFQVTSAGKPLCNAEIMVVDAQREPIAENRVGEIAIRSDCMLSGYHNNPKATSAALEGGWYFTGDLGFLHHGNLYITGRQKDVIIVGGENIYPQDIEAVFNDHPQLIAGRNVVFGIADERVGTEKIIALAESHEPAANIDTSAIRKTVLDKLNIPLAEIRILPHQDLKKGTAGKISRYLNRQRFLSGQRQITKAKPSSVQGLKKTIAANFFGNEMAPVESDTQLISSGQIDSFGFTELVHIVESELRITIPQQLWTIEHFDSIGQIEKLVQHLQSDQASALQPRSDEQTESDRTASLESLRNTERRTDRPPFWESVINSVPLARSWIYRILFRAAGIQLGKNVQFLGRVHVKLRGNPSQITIGDDVILGDKVDLRIRENGRINLAPKSYLDTNVRLVAAREGFVEIGEGSEIGANSVINSGGETRIGRYVMIAGNVQINSSSHGTAKSKFIKSQSHDHGSVTIGDDVWLGSGVSVIMNSTIEDGVVVSSNSLVSGTLPRYAICAGVPATIIRQRS